jgi:hypothetical protein
MRSLILPACLLVISSPATAKLVTGGPGVSWGKAGISLDQYRRDAIACGLHASGSDLEGTDPAKAMVVASRRIENDPNGGPNAVQDGTQPPGAAYDALGSSGSTASVTEMANRQIGKAGDILKRELERCLAGLGYHPFKLTGEQKRKLARLPAGSDARHAYLHSLASNPDILEHQAVN